MKADDVLMIKQNQELYSFVEKCYRNSHFLEDFTDDRNFIPKYSNFSEYVYERNSVDESLNLSIEFLKLSDDDKALFKRLWRIKKNMCMRKYRYKKILSKWLNMGLQVVFLSLTFDDDMINKGFDHCRKFITTWLSDYCYDYMANDDYGDENQRLHFHAIAILKDSSNLKKIYIDKYQVQHYKLLNYPYVSDVSMVIRGDTDRVTRYFNKIANHAFKASAISSHSIIRPRRKNIK